MFFNSDGLNFVQNNHTKTEWVYLREMVQVSQDSEERAATFNIISGVKQPKHIFVCLQRTVGSSNQEHNPHNLDAFKDVHKVNGGHFLNSTIAESKYETYCLAKTICQFRDVGFPTHFTTRWNT